jgi:hypothetical protein
MNIKCTECLLNIPNVLKIFQIAINYNTIFPFKALQNLPKFLVPKETIWQPWNEDEEISKKRFFFRGVQKRLFNLTSSSYWQTIYWKALLYNYLVH